MSGESDEMDCVQIVAALEQIKTVADECIRTVKKGSRRQSSNTRHGKAQHHKWSQLDLDKPILPFIKTYARGLSGPKKFALVLGWLSKGDLKKEVALKEIEKRWNKMTSILEMRFNGFFAARAKENDWVDSKKRGFYNLRPNWKDAVRM